MDEPDDIDPAPLTGGEGFTLTDLFRPVDQDDEGPLKVLVVDDEPYILRALQRLLKREGLEILSANSGSEAITLLRANTIGVLISDQFMPEMRGIELLRHAQDHYPECVRVMLTGNSDLMTAVDAINKGDVFRFINKPWQNEEFVRIIELAVEQHHLLVGRRRYEQFIHEQNATLRRVNDELDRRVRERTAELSSSREQIDKLYRELQVSFDATLLSMLSIMELGDVQIVDHCRRTMRRITQYAEAERLPAPLIRSLERAALLHWIGLITAPSEMFSRLPEDYGAEEQAIWEFHPLLGQQTLHHIPALARVGQIIVHYLRQCQDSEFYPGALLDGEEIDEELVFSCHLLRLCSAYEHIQTALRRQGVRDDLIFHERGVGQLLRHSGTLYEPRLVRRFIDVTQKHIQSPRHERRLSSISELKPGMVLARQLEMSRGSTLAPSNITVTAELLERLMRFDSVSGLGAIYIWS
jgi:response regulator RpfG family c-di-GMP phosphodiesterase